MEAAAKAVEQWNQMDIVSRGKKRKGR